METGLRVLVVDDEKMITDAVSAYFTKMGCTVYTSDTGKGAIDIFEKEKIDFIILDLMLPILTGEEVCKRIREKSTVPIIMLTAKTQEESILNGLEIGADDYVTKPFSIKQLFARMTAILRRIGKPPVSDDNAFSFEGGLNIDFSLNEVRRNDQLLNLTKSEWKILSSMIKHPKKVFTRNELMQIVFGDDADSFDRVIDTHIKNLRKKLEADPKNPVYLKTVHGIGYKFGGERT